VEAMAHGLFEITIEVQRQNQSAAVASSKKDSSSPAHG
jgi:hypothetical protein